MRWVHLAYRVDPDWKRQPRYAEEALRNIDVEATQIDRGYNASKANIPAIQGWILEQIETKIPDVLFIEGANAAAEPRLVTPAFLKQCRPFCKYILLWWGEVRSRPLTGILSLAPHVDRMLIVSSGQRSVYLQAGFPKVQEFHLTLPKSAVIKAKSAKAMSILFAGTNYHRQGYPLSRERMKLVEAFNGAFEDFWVMGAGWDRRRLRHYLGYENHLPIVRERMHAAAVVLGINSFDLMHYYPRRTWEALSSGSCYLVKRIPGMDRDFRNRTNVVTYNTTEEAVDIAAHLIKTRGWEAIGEAGQQLFRARWTLEHTFERLLESL